MNAKQLADEIGWGRIITFVLRDCPFIGLVFFGLYKLPEIDQAIHRGYQSNASLLKEVADAYATAAEKRDATIRAILQRFRDDEREDRRLLVEILRRSDLTGDDLHEALEAAEIDEEPSG